ncbi:MAG TPA: SpoIIE family protein phosphatase [Bryobacteraceae bacterium]|nr:SpoIIE family protein phosphatase [Bryobacteraceae bacterium]
MERSTSEAALDVIHPSGERTRIPITPLPFRIGRGPDNQLILRDNRASRAHASIKSTENGFAIEDLDSLHGTWVNGRRIQEPTILQPGDSIHFGFEDGYHLLFSTDDDRLNRLLNRLSSVTTQPGGAAGQFARLRAVLDVARTLQTSLAADEVLAAVLQTALTLTGAERAFLILRSGDDLIVRLGRDARGRPLPTDALSLPREVISRALNDRRDLLSMPLDSGMRNVICVPLVSLGSINAQETVSVSAKSGTLGLIYLDSHQQTTVPELNLELLHTLALEASTVLENTNVLERERQKMLLDQELELARKIQQNLLPRKFPSSGWLRAAGSSLPSSEVSGDYFDLHQIDEDSWAAVIADVSGKGISSALLASLLQGAFLLGSDLAASLDEVVCKINGFLFERAEREKYATLFYATIHSSGLMECVNAGHCAPLVITPAGGIKQLQTTGMPLGLWRNAHYGVERVRLTPGDKIVAFSDGVTEAANDKNESFEPRLPEFLKQCRHLDVQQLHDKLIEQVLQFQQGVPQRDDITALILEYRGLDQS